MAALREKRLEDVSAILFDLDNTLVATRAIDQHVCDEVRVLLKRKWKLQTGEARQICDAFLTKFRQCPDHPQMDLDDWRTLLWADALGPKHQHLTSEVFSIWRTQRYTNFTFDPSVDDMLVALKDRFRVGLITNGTSRAQWEKLEALQSHRYFDCVFISGDYEVEKPHPDIFHMACDFLHLPPEECIMVGDRIETDILGGKTAGLRATVWITNEQQHPLADYAIGHVTELNRLLGMNR